MDWFRRTKHEDAPATTPRKELPKPSIELYGPVLRHALNRAIDGQFAVDHPLKLKALPDTPERAAAVGETLLQSSAALAPFQEAVGELSGVVPSDQALKHAHAAARSYLGLLESHYGATHGAVAALVRDNNPKEAGALEQEGERYREHGLAVRLHPRDWIAVLYHDHRDLYRRMEFSSRELSWLDLDRLVGQ
jgi:hypothetical protein